MHIEELAARYSKAWAARDLDAILALHSEDTIFHLHGPGSGEAKSAETVRDVFARLLRKTPDLRFETRRAHLGLEHFVSEYVMSGTSGGIQFACDGVDVIAVRGGRIARKDSYLDWAAYAAQLGAEPAAFTQPRRLPA